MKILVACIKDEATKAKGDLLESLAKDLLAAQHYDVIEEIRFTGMELDLLCEHRVSKRQVYVECKAQSDAISAAVLRQLLGTITFKNYAEGWLVSTAEFGKEAKGFAHEWQSRPPAESSKLSFYTPDRVIGALQDANVICNPPIEEATHRFGKDQSLGEWFLLLSRFGRFWGVYTLNGGAPAGVVFYEGKSAQQERSPETLRNLATLDSPFAQYDLLVGAGTPESYPYRGSLSLPKVVEVQTGDSWNDYRPSRPEDFVGRDESQKVLLGFLDDVRTKKTATRIFAITGNSGLGKSSLIAKLRDRARNKFHKNRFFVSAVDIRGATSPGYISAALLGCLNKAQKAGFGHTNDLVITDPSSPLSSDGMREYLKSLDDAEQVICLVFDQFEELYSKPELFSIFTAARHLMIEVSSAQSPLTLGFAWKTDSTTQQDHPAYHLWHDLADHRRSFKLDVFTNGEIAKALTTFEKAVGIKIPAEIRHQISYSCQGFPWLLKKLCINLAEGLKKGVADESALVDLDVGRLFESDLELLSPSELACLRMIARSAPADWSEVIENSGVQVLNALVNKRLVVKSGDRLNVYWDIFKDYLLTGATPVVPFNYIPTNDFSTMSRVLGELQGSKYTSAETVAAATGLKERTVWNVGADLVMLRLAERKGTQFKRHRDLRSTADEDVLPRLRDSLSRHSLKLALHKTKPGKSISKGEVLVALRGCITSTDFAEKTLTTYSTRMVKLLALAGFLVEDGSSIQVHDIGRPGTKRAGGRGRSRGSGTIFQANASPSAVCQALELIGQGTTYDQLADAGFVNAVAVLRRFELVELIDGKITSVSKSIDVHGGDIEAVWASAKGEPVMEKCLQHLAGSSSGTGSDLGDALASTYGLSWSAASKQRNGNSLLNWARWIAEGVEAGMVPPPPGRKKSTPSS